MPASVPRNILPLILLVSKDLTVDDHISDHHWVRFG
jgi:hypothetical protein